MYIYSSIKQILMAIMCVHTFADQLLIVAVTYYCCGVKYIVAFELLTWPVDRESERCVCVFIRGWSFSLNVWIIISIRQFTSPPYSFSQSESGNTIELIKVGSFQTNYHCEYPF